MIADNRPIVLAVAVAGMLVFTAKSFSLLTPLLDIDALRGIPYVKSAIVLLTDAIVGMLLLCLVGRRPPAFVLNLSGILAPIVPPLKWGAITLGPAAVACFAFAPISKDVTLRDLVCGAALGPFLEEFLFRGLAVGTLVRLCGWPRLPAFLLPAAFFGAAHASQGSDLGSIDGVIGITAAGGLLFGWLFVRWNFNLWPAVILHVGLNALCMVFDLGESAVGGWFGNSVRLAAVAIAIGATIRLAPENHGGVQPIAEQFRSH